jgi:hypothetical protein
MSSASLSNSSPQDSRSNIHSSVSEKQIIDNVLAMLNESTAGKERIATLLQLRDSPNFISALTDLRTNGITARDAEYILRLSLNVQSRFIPTLIRTTAHMAEEAIRFIDATAASGTPPYSIHNIEDYESYLSSVKGAIFTLKNFAVEDNGLYAPPFISRFADCIAVIIHRSKFPHYDLCLLKKISSIIPPEAIIADTLATYYKDKNYSYIYDVTVFNESAPSALDAIDLKIAAQLSTLPGGKSPAERQMFIPVLRRVPQATLSTAWMLIRRACQLSLPNEDIITILDNIDYFTTTDGKCLPGVNFTALLKVNDALSPSAFALVAEFAQLRTGAPREIFPLLARSKIAALEEHLVRTRKTRHQQHEDLPLDEVLTRFTKKSLPDSEPANPAALERALRVYSRVLEDGHQVCCCNRATFQAKIESMIAFVRDPQNNEADARAKYFTYARELAFRTTRKFPYSIQILQALLLLDYATFGPAGIPHPESVRGAYAGIPTGEGKTLLIALLAGYVTLRKGHPSYVMTHNIELARRDQQFSERFFRTLHIASQTYSNAKSRSLAAGENGQIFYTTKADIAWSQIHYRNDKHSRPFHDVRHATALFDEFDVACLDHAGNAMQIAGSGANFSLSSMRKMLTFVASLDAKLLTEDLPHCVQRMLREDRELKDFDPVLIGAYLRSAKSAYSFQKNYHYIIKDRKIVIIDYRDTGRLLETTSWTHGLDAFIALKEGLSPTLQEHSEGLINTVDFIRQFSTALLVTGAVGNISDRRQMRELYRFPGFDSLGFKLSRRKDHPISVVLTKPEWHEEILELAQRIVREAERPLLLHCESIADAELFSAMLGRQGFKTQLLTDANNLGPDGKPAKEASILHTAGRPGVITITSGPAARGADIILSAATEKNGGLYSLLTFIPSGTRPELQARGRAGRQGQAGDSKVIACISENSFFAKLLPELREQLEELVLNYGSTSSQINQTLSFLRGGQRLLETINQRMHIEGRPEIRRGFDIYLAARIAHNLRDTSSSREIADDVSTPNFVTALLRNMLRQREIAGRFTPLASGEENKLLADLDNVFTHSFERSREDLQFQPAIGTLAAELFEHFAKQIGEAGKIRQIFKATTIARCLREVAALNVRKVDGDHPGLSA